MYINIHIYIYIYIYVAPSKKHLICPLCNVVTQCAGVMILTLKNNNFHLLHRYITCI